MAALLLLNAWARVAAQSPSLVPVPMVKAFAGLPAGGSASLCASDIPNSGGAHLGDGCLPTEAELASVYGAFTDAIGNVYVTENGTNNDIRVVYRGGATLAAMLTAASAKQQNFTPQPGYIYTLGGGLAGKLTVKSGSKYSCDGTATGPPALDSSGNGCPATEAYLKPRGMSVDPDGDVFFVSTAGGNTVKVIYAGGGRAASLITMENPGVTPQIGYVYQLAGQSTASYSGDGGLASSAGLVVVRDVAVDTYGNLFVADGTTPATAGGTDAAAGNNVRVIYAGVQAPAGMSGLTPGYIYTYAGGSGCTPAITTTSCPAGFGGDGQPATAALFNSPYTLFFDRFNNLYIADYTNGRVRVVYSGGSIPGIMNPQAGYAYTYAGGGTLSANGSAASQLGFGIVQTAGIDGAGDIYLEDRGGKVIWRFDALTGTGFVTAGKGSAAASSYCSGTTGPVATDNFGDGCPATQARFSDVGRISFDPEGNGYLGDNSDGIVRKLLFETRFPPTAVGSSASEFIAYLALSDLALDAETFTLEAQPSAEFSDDGNGSCNASSMLTAGKSCAFGVSFSPLGAGLREGMQSLGSSTGTVGGSPLSGVGVAAVEAIDPGTQMSLGSGLTPAGVTTDPAGNVYLSDAGGTVYKGAADGTALSALVTGLSEPAGIAVDAGGNLYIAESGNNQIVKTDPAGEMLATLGSGLDGPRGVAVDTRGTLFVADTGNNRVVEIAPNSVQTVAPLSGLSAPTRLSLGIDGNLYVVDSGNNRVLELSGRDGQTAIGLPEGTTPAAVAVDAAGTLYVADSGSKQVVRIPRSTSAGATGASLISGLGDPVDLATDAFGDLYVADSQTASGIAMRRTAGGIVLPFTNVNGTSTAGFSLTNTGNASLNFPTSTLDAVTGSELFSVAPAGVGGCAEGIPYAPGEGCSFTTTFEPTAEGDDTAQVTFSTNAVNTSSVVALLSGSARNLAATSISLAMTPAQGPIFYGQSIQLTATVTPASNSGVPVGTITFTVNGKAQTALPYGDGTVGLTLTPPVGPYSVSAVFSGDEDYASSSASTSFTVGPAPTMTALTVAPQDQNGALVLVLTAHVTSSTASGETGSVGFYAGSTLIGSSSLGPDGSAAYNSSTLGYPTNSFTAVYSGDANFQGATSAAVAPAPDFVVAAAATSVSIPQGGVATLGYVLSPLYNATGSITPTCSGLPANTACRFQPVTAALSGPVSLQLLVYTNVASSARLESGERDREGLFGLLTLSMPLLLYRLRRRKVHGLFVTALSGAVLLSLSGCGSGSSAARSDTGLVTPTGTTTVTVTFAGADPLTAHTSVFTLTVLAGD